MNTFTAGAAQLNITPSLGCNINGDFYPHQTKLIHDDLFAKAIVLKNNDQLLLMIVVDICTMSQDFLDEVKALIWQTTGIAPGSCMISCTHTHGAGAIEDAYLASADQDYRKRLKAKLVELSALVITKMKPAKFATGSVDVPEHVLCRRYYLKGGQKSPNPVTGGEDIIKTNPFNIEDQIDRPASTPDPQLSYFGIKDMEDQWISIFANYSLHYVGDWDNGTITADYYGTFAARIKSRLSADDSFVALLSNGTSGDINIWDFMDPSKQEVPHFSKSERIGHDLADKLFDTLGDLNWDTDPTVVIMNTSREYAIRKPDTKELETAKERVKVMPYREPSYTNEALKNIYAREQILLNERGDTCTVPMQAIKIGALTIGTLPGEYFAETGLRLKSDNNDGPYFTIGIANGNIGYVPPIEQFELGGYETWRSRYSSMTSGVEADSRSVLQELIEKVKTK